jgi:hypothetical protein
MFSRLSNLDYVILARASNNVRPKDPTRTRTKIIGAKFISISFSENFIDVFVLPQLVVTDFA